MHLGLSQHCVPYTYIQVSWGTSFSSSDRGLAKFMNFQAGMLLDDGLVVISRIKNLCVKVLDVETSRECTNLICMGYNYYILTHILGHC